MDQTGPLQAKIQRKLKATTKKRNFSRFSRIFCPRTFPFKTKGFSSKRTKEQKKNKKNRTNRCCTLVASHLFLRLKMDHFGLANAKIQFRNKVILTKMVVWTILDHLGPVHFPTVPQPFPTNVKTLCNFGLQIWLETITSRDANQKCLF